MFEIAWSELLIVIIVAIVVVGPKELPGLLRTIGRVVGKLRRSADEFRRQFDESIREAGGEDLKRELDQLRHHNPLNQIRNTIEDAAREATQPLPPPSQPQSSPPPPSQPSGDSSPALTKPWGGTELAAVEPEAFLAAQSQVQPQTGADATPVQPPASDPTAIVQPPASGEDHPQNPPDRSQKT